MQIVKDEETSATEVVATFDPSKKYKWTPSTQFILSGSQFASLLNATRSFLATEEAQKVLWVKEGADVLEQQLKEAVESGRAQEIE